MNIDVPFAQPAEPGLTPLVRAAVGGDEAAFAALWRALNPVLERYLRVKAGAAAEDLAAETWAAVVPRLGGFVGGEPELRSWIFTIARSKVVDDTRRHARRPLHLVEDWAGLEPADPVDVAARALETCAAGDTVELLALLPPEQAEIVSLRVLADLDVATVAQIVGKTPGAVRVAQHRALKQLARLVSEAQVTR